MEENILNLVSDDYYSLWEVRDVLSRKDASCSYEKIKAVAIDLVRQGKILCYVSPDLDIDRLELVSGSEAIDLLEAEESWLIPTKEGTQIVRLTVADTR